MSDLIDRQAAIEAFQMFRKYESNRSNSEWVNRIEVVLKNQPTIDAVPVVKCKDCEWWDDNYRECGSPNWYPDQDGSVLQPAGMFCGWAERRTDETD